MTKEATPKELLLIYAQRVGFQDQDVEYIAHLIDLERETCAEIASRPYSDEVGCFGFDQPLTVANKIVIAINKGTRRNCARISRKLPPGKGKPSSSWWNPCPSPTCWRVPTETRPITGSKGRWR